MRIRRPRYLIIRSIEFPSDAIEIPIFKAKTICFKRIFSYCFFVCLLSKNGIFPIYPTIRHKPFDFLTILKHNLF